MSKTMVALGLVGIMALTATTALAWGPGAGRGMGYGPGPGSGYGPGAAVSTLSPEQAAKIRKIRSDRFAEAAKVRTEMVTKRTALQALFREPVLDQAKIVAKQKEMTARQAQMQEKTLAAWMAVANVLTPEQRAQLPTVGPGTGSGFGPGRGFGPEMGMGRMGMGPRMGDRSRW
jgi:Spy/CpxP family protein refolding chaperone